MSKRLSELEAALGEAERPVRRGGDPEVESIAIDSREVEQGDLFVALVGENFDGHRYVDEAFASGAEAVMVQHARTERFERSGPILAVEDTRRALGPVAAAFYDHPSKDLEMIGTTGTNGKTTTTHLVASIFRSAGRAVGRIGTLGYAWNRRQVEGANTTPESVVTQRLLAEMRADGVDTVAMEVSSHGISMHRLRGTTFDAGVFTNLSSDHLDFHGDFETYRRVKRSFLLGVLGESATTKEPTAVVNVGDEAGARWFEELRDHQGIEVVTYCTGRNGPPVDVRATVESRSLTETGITVEYGGRELKVDFPLLGDYNVENAAAAAAAAIARGIRADSLRRGLESVPTIDGRLERISATPDDPAVFVDYAHSPDALRRVLETLTPLTSGRLFVVFGCGGDRDREKRPEMGRIAATVADCAVVTSDNPRSESPRKIVEQILEGARRGSDDAAKYLIVEIERRTAIERAVREADVEDTVLIAGKGHEEYQEIEGRRRPFDDRKVAMRALEQTP